MNMHFYKTALTGFEFLAAIIGFLNWSKIKGNYWQYFPFYLLVLTMSDLVSIYLPSKSVNIYYTYFIIPLEFLFVFYLFKNNLKYNKLVWGCITVYIISFLIEIIYENINQKNVFLSVSYSVGNLLLLILILRYFYFLIYSERILSFNTEPMFWVSLGLLLFYLGTFPYYGLYNLLKTKYFDILVSYTWIMIFLNYAMYLLFAASFIWGKEK
jgi:hypothetical protein